MFARRVVNQTRLLYAGAHRMTSTELAVLDLSEGNARRAPGQAPGMMALEVAMDEMAEELGLDPVEFRIRNDTQVDPEKPSRPFSQRKLIDCMRLGAGRFGWARRQPVGNWASAARLPRWPTRSTTPAVCACASTRSRWTSCSRSCLGSRRDQADGPT